MRLARSLRARLTVGLLTGVGLIVIVASLSFRIVATTSLQHEFDRALLIKSQALIALIDQDEDGIEFDFADELMPEFDREIEPEFFQLWLDDGTTLERSHALDSHDLPRPAVEPKGARIVDTRLPDGRAGRLVHTTFVPLIDDDSDAEDSDAEDSDNGAALDTEHLPENPTDDVRAVDARPDSTATESSARFRSASLSVAVSREPLNARLHALDLALLAFVFGLLAGIAILVRLMVPVALRPLEFMTRQVRDLDAESLGTRIRLDKPPSELLPVVNQVNDLIDRMEDALDRERRLSSNLAHELRTPIAELRNLALVAGRWPGDTEAVQRYFEDVILIASQMERIVVHLLALARYEGGSERVTLDDFDLGDVVQRAWQAVAPIATDRKISFELELPPLVMVNCDQGKLEIMIANLLGNAVAYAPAGDPIQCVVSTHAKRVTLAVSNRAPDLTSDHVTHMFDRFWRKDISRTGGGHAGLGLTLVHAFAELLNIAVETQLVAGTFRIALVLPPAATDPASEV